MKQHVRTVAIAVMSFAIGAAVTHLPQPARAAAAPLLAGTYDLSALTPEMMPKPFPTLPNLLSKTMVVDDGMTLAVVMGTAAKHQHYTVDEIQIVLEGTGTEWLGDKQVALKPGTMLIIPRNTTHGGLVDLGHLKFVAIKTPPQDPSDIHFVP